MKIKMLESRRYAMDGFTVCRYHAQGEYDLPETTAHRFVRNGWAVSVGPVKTMEQELAEIVAGIRQRKMA